MNWIILATGIIISILGMYVYTDMHSRLEEQGHHWSKALNIGSTAGSIMGFGFGLVMTAIILLLSSML
jgi:hypothetical protein